MVFKTLCIVVVIENETFNSKIFKLKSNALFTIHIKTFIATSMCNHAFTGTYQVENSVYV